jgi:hypothetical protein
MKEEKKDISPKNKDSSQEFTSEEYKAIENFFETKIACQTDINIATKAFASLLSDRSINIKLRNRLIESFLYASDSVRFNIIIFN